MTKDSAGQSGADVESEDQALFDRIARQYARKDSTPSSRIAREYQLRATVGKTLFREPKVNRVLEIACGIGASAKYLEGRYEHYVGVDHSAEMIDIARWFNRDNAKASFVCGNAKENLDLGPADVVLAVGALHHMTDLDQLFETLQRQAAPGARFIALEPYSGNPLIQALRRVRAKLDHAYSADQSFFSRTELQDLLARKGMTEIELVNQGFFTPPFAQVIMPPQFLAAPMSRLATWLDRGIDRVRARWIGRWSWNIIIRARFPD